MKKQKIQFILTIFLSSLLIFTIVKAGSLTPSASPSATMHSLTDIAGSSFVTATHSLKALYDKINSLVAGVWDKATSELTTVGSIGKLLVDNVDTTISSRASSNTALATTTWTNTMASYLDFLNSDLKFLVSSSTASTTPFAGSIAYNISSSTAATSTDTIFGWFKTTYDYTAPSSTALTTGTWTDARAGYLDAISQSGYSSTTINANADGNILERLKYLENRNMFSVVNQKNGAATSPATDFAFWTQAKGGVDDYNDNGTMPTDSFTVSWTQCTSANNYCKTGDSTVCTGDVCYQDNSTGLIWSDYLESGTNKNWFWANNCWEPGTWANSPGGDNLCNSDGDDACQCVKATSTPNITGCDALGNDGDWRLPYQKELMQAYIDGSWGNLPNAGNYFWSATTISGATHYAWRVALYNGHTYGTSKSSTGDSRCVR